MSSIVRSARPTSVLVLMLVIAGWTLPLRSTAAMSAGMPLPAQHQWQREQVGQWQCRGRSTLRTGTEEPYVGRFTNYWSQDDSTLLLHFVEDRTDGPAFEETQRWVAGSSNENHTRALVTNDGSFGFLRAHAPQGNVMEWAGLFVTPRGTMRLSETLTRISDRDYHWAGELIAEGQWRGAYWLRCSKTSI